MLCEGQRDRWQSTVLVGDEVVGSVRDEGLFPSLFGQFFSLVVSNNVCVSSDFVDGDNVMRVFQCLYYSGYEEFV